MAGLRLTRTTIRAMLVSILFLSFPGTAFTAETETEVREPGSDRGARTQVNELPPTTVIATKTPKAAMDSPASVTIIGEQEINALVNEHPLKPLIRVEGVYPRQYRGLADFWARPMIRGRRALVMVDGVNWYDFAYTYNFADIPMPDVERIDLVRGPYSSLYGTLAQTGVVNYITRIPEGREIEARAQYGAWNSRFVRARLADRPFGSGLLAENLPSLKRAIGDRFFYSLSLKYRNTDGYVTTPSFFTPKDPVSDPLDPSIPTVVGWQRDITPKTGSLRYQIGDQGDNRYEDLGMFFKTGYDVSDHTRIWYSLNFGTMEYGWKDGKSNLLDPSVPGNLYNGEAYIQDGGDTYVVSVNPNMFTANPYSRKGLVHTLHFSHTLPGSLDLLGVFGYNDKEDTVRNLSKSQYTTNDNDLIQLDLLSTVHLWGERILLSVGFQGIQEDLTTHLWNLADPFHADTVYSLREYTQGMGRNLGAFVQAEFTPIRYLSLYLGGRYDHWWSSDARYENISGVMNEYPDTDEGHASPKFAVVVRPLENGTIRAAYGEAFTAPSLKDRLSSYEWSGGGTTSIYHPNPDLKPEINRSWEIGTEWDFFRRQLHCKVTYFENRFEDLITYVDTEYVLPDGTRVTERRRINAESAEVRGVETALEATLPWNLKAAFYYTHNWSEFTKTQDPKSLGDEVPEVPTDMWSLVFGYHGTHLEATINYRYSDSPYPDSYDLYNDHAFGGYDAYHIVDLQATVRPWTNLALSFGVDNLLDEEYFEYYRAPGRFWLATVSATF